MEKKGYGIGKRTKREIGTPLMVINIKQEIIDILQIANRRFMYNPKIGILILFTAFIFLALINECRAYVVSQKHDTRFYELPKLRWQLPFVSQPLYFAQAIFLL